MTPQLKQINAKTRNQILYSRHKVNATDCANFVLQFFYITLKTPMTLLYNKITKTIALIIHDSQKLVQK